MHADESLITPELQELVGRDGPAAEHVITPEIVARVLETMEDHDPRWQAATAPPYILMAFGADLPLPDTPAAPLGLVTGDEWTLARPLRVGERLTSIGRLESVHERFGSRFGHNLVLRTTWTFRDERGDVVAEAARGFIRYRPPAEERWREGEEAGGRAEPAGIGRTGRQSSGPGLVSIPTQPSGRARRTDDAPPGAEDDRSVPLLASLHEGDEVRPRVLRPTLGQVVRYCALTWNFVPFFFDPDEARRAGLPGPIVPGPLKLALITRYLDAWAARGGGAVRAVRCAHRRPDRGGVPLTVRAIVRGVAEDGRVDCEVWTENAAGERSVVGSASLTFPPA